mmetsp:Transcript_41675/g.94170  ORF Transcript_41675/g.94170 Transcript_41675/m.94170 type:complete len:83 (-) Transcript_41675:366-614(-)
MLETEAGYHVCRLQMQTDSQLVEGWVPLGARPLERRSAAHNSLVQSLALLSLKAGQAGADRCEVVLEFLNMTKQLSITLERR